MKYSGVEWIGEIPDNWSVRPVRECLFERNEKNELLLENTILSLSAKDGVTLYDGENHSGNKPREDLSGYKIVKENDIVANSMNILSGSVGLSKYNGVVSPVYYIYHIRNSKDNIRYFNYIFQCNEFQKNLRRLGKGILIRETEDGKLNTIRTKVPSYQLSIENIPYPNENLQNSIVKLLDEKTAEIDSLIEIENQQIEKLKEYKQAVITEAVTRGLDKKAPLKDSGVEWIGNIPKTWMMNRLKFVASYNDESLKDDTNPEKLINYVDISSVSLEKGITNIDSFKFKDAPSRARRITNTGDIIVSTVRTYLKAIATINEENLIVSTGFCVIRPTTKMNKKYVEFWCKSNKFTDEVSRNSYGISYPAINATSLIGFWITMPPIVEQNDIVDYLDSKCCEIDALISIKRKKIDELNEYKKSLIYECVTGKKEVC